MNEGGLKVCTAPPLRDNILIAREEETVGKKILLRLHWQQCKALETTHRSKRTIGELSFEGRPRAGLLYLLLAFQALHTVGKFVTLPRGMQSYSLLLASPSSEFSKVLVDCIRFFSSAL